MEILLIGSADSIFFEHYCKNLKLQKPDIKIDIFSVSDVSGKYDLSSCDNVTVSAWDKSCFKKIKGVRTIIKPFYSWFSLYSFLKRNKNKWDIIHFKWLVPEAILFPTITSKYSSKSIATFWGAEFNTQHFFYSNLLYRYLLKNFLKCIDVITYATIEQRQEIQKHCNNEYKLNYAIYGSSIYEQIERLVASEPKKKSKGLLGINENKITISIGYSGKELHQHSKIIKTLFEYTKFINEKDKFVIILPMNHGCTGDYINKIEALVKSYKANYKLLTKKMTDAEIARLRNATDIMIQLSTTDGRSASIIESLLAGAILISGDWLPYKVFKEKKLYFHELSKIDSSLPALILKISSNINDELKICQGNKKKWGFETWKKVIKNWIDIYDALLKETPA